MVSAGPAAGGGGGGLKVPHAVALHGLQVLVALGWLLQFTALSERRRTAVVLAAAAGYLGLIGGALLQAGS